MPHPDYFATGKETQYLLYRRLGGPQCWYEWMRKNLTPTKIQSLDHVAPSILLHQLCYPSLFLQYIHQYLLIDRNRLLLPSTMKHYLC